MLESACEFSICPGLIILATLALSRCFAQCGFVHMLGYDGLEPGVVDFPARKILGLRLPGMRPKPKRKK